MLRKIDVPWETAFRGGLFSFWTDHGEVTVDVPPGCEIGHAWRIKRKGKPGDPPGDLTVKVAGYAGGVPWRIVGRDVYMKVSVTLFQSYVRETVFVQSPWGVAFDLCHELGKMEPTKIKRHGVKKGVTKGDLIVEWELIYPPRGSLELASLLRYLQRTP